MDYDLLHFMFKKIKDIEVMHSYSNPEKTAKSVTSNILFHSQINF